MAYGEHDQQRWVPDAGTRADRSQFARDRARVMHSSALRRLGAKTQVLQAGQADFPRTRLTHSLECAQVGRELGASLGCDPDLVDAACLSHDLGHPPFGHNGESELNTLAAGIGGFEGNAQSFRLLTRLEPKALGSAGHPRVGESVGLNLTRAALDAASKYPWPRSPERAKFGVYDDDMDVFAWVREGAPGERTCMEAQVMDWADDVSYSVHDIEDAIHGGHMDIDIMSSASGRSEVIDIAREWYGHGYSADGLDAALTRLQVLPEWPAGYDGTLRSLAAMKNLTSTLIGRFCQAAADATRAQSGEGDLQRYGGDLVVPGDSRYEVTALKALAARFVMNRSGADEVYRRQRALVADLVSAISADPERTLDPLHLDLWRQADDDQARLRIVIDQVASLTDVSVGHWHHRLCS